MRKNCPICDKYNEPKSIHVMKSNSANARDFNISIAKCEDCNFKYQAPEISSSVLNDIYENDYIGGAQSQKERYESSLIVRKSSALSFKRYITNSKNFSILEIGSSSGYNLENIAREFPLVDLEGVDLDKESVQYGISRGVNVSTNNAFASSKKYDVIFLNHVFEHIVDMDSFLIEVRKLTKDKSIVAINVPNSRKWIEDVSWEHVNYFSEEAMKNLLEKNGFVNFDMESFVIHRKLHRIPEIRLIIRFGGLEEIKPPVDDVWGPSDNNFINRIHCRNAYDKSENRGERKKIAEQYKAHKSGRKISEWLLWSRLYVFFTPRFSKR